MIQRVLSVGLVVAAVATTAPGTAGFAQQGGVAQSAPWSAAR